MEDKKIENVKEDANKEAQLLYGNDDKYGIYQLKRNPELRELRFECTESLKRMGIIKDNFDAIKPENYEFIYAGDLNEFAGRSLGETLEAIYTKFNIDHPEDFRGHSLSVSDVVILHQNGENTAHFVDRFGFTGLPDFMREMENMQEYDTLEHDAKKSEEKSMETEDEIIDLGDETEQVLSEMRQFLVKEPEVVETELAFQLADRYITIQEVDGGYDYTIVGEDYRELDGGVYDNPDISIREALNEIVLDLKQFEAYETLRGSIKEEDELQPIDYDELMEKVEEANRIQPQSSVVEEFRAKTNELFHDISELNAEEVEETVKCHVQAKIDEYGINATIVGAVVTGSRCRGLEREDSDLDVVVELSTTEREDDLFKAFNEDGLHIGKVKVDINPITAERTGTLENYLPRAEEYLANLREAREQEVIEQLPDMDVRVSLKKGLPEGKKEEKIAKLAAEIDQYAYDFDPYEYKDSVDDREAQVASIAEDIRSGNTDYLSDFLNAAISNEIKDSISDIFGRGTDIEDSEAVQNARKAKELLDKLAEYKPLAKIEELEEQNYNMIDNVLNNGAGEKSQREEHKKEQACSERPSLKARLAEKQIQVSGKARHEAFCQVLF